MPTIHPPTRAEQYFRAGGYILTASIGFTIMLHPTQQIIERELGWASVIWSLFIASSLIAAVATLLGRYRVEYALLPLFTTALVVAVLAVWLSAAHNPSDPSLVTRAAASSALSCLFCARWIALNRIVRVERWTRPN